MATPNTKLAEALSAMKIAERGGVIRHDALTRTMRERLVATGFLKPIIKGWYYITEPSRLQNETVWFAFYWEFVQQYFESRFANDYCLAPESSLLVHAGSTRLPLQLLVATKTGGTMTLNLPGNLSIIKYKDDRGFPEEIASINGLNVLRMADALVRVPESFFVSHADDVSTLLKSITDPSAILTALLENGKSTVAGRIAGAFRAVHKADMADEITHTMKKAGYTIRESNPFVQRMPKLNLPQKSQIHEIRLREMWHRMRDQVREIWPAAPGLPRDTSSYLKRVADEYAQDAYHSLSIEGYRVDSEMIERVRSGDWNPDGSQQDRESRDAMAARGYFEAFQEVKSAIDRLVNGEPVSLIRTVHRDWHRALFAPSVQAGIAKPSDLAGYRNSQVYIVGSKHVPLPHTTLPDAMSTFFDLLETESEASVRAVLGHFMFVYIHPYSDGNGRLGRFLMNSMLASGGFPWTVIRLSQREEYMTALEKASVESQIKPLASFILDEMNA